jgi:hypothetical protein
MEVDASRTAGTPPPRVKRNTSAHKTGWTQSVMVPPWCIQRRVQIPPPPSSRRYYWWDSGRFTKSQFNSIPCGGRSSTVLFSWVSPPAPPFIKKTVGPHMA